MASKREGARLTHSVVLGQTMYESPAAATSASVAAIMRHPSSRLRCTVSLAFEQVEAGTVTYVAASHHWTLTARRENPITGKGTNLHTLSSAQPLPDAFTLDDNLSVVRITASIAPFNLLGHWVLMAVWEPAAWGYDEEALDELFARCALQMDGPTFRITAET